MNKKTVITGLAVLALAGAGYAIWKKKSESNEEGTSKFSSACGCGA
jgi:hypothetical protein